MARVAAGPAARFTAHRLAVGGLVVLIAITAFAFAGPLVWRWDYLIHLQIPSNQAPSWAHPFGTTRPGQDVMALVMRGCQHSLETGALAGLISTILATAWGSIAGYYRGWVDTVLMRIVDVVIIIPLLVVVVVLTGAGGVGWAEIAVTVALFEWCSGARVVRGVVLSLAGREYVQAARVMGTSNRAIIVRHLIPNAASQIVVIATFAVTAAILAEAALSFVGFGIAPPDTSLGLLASQGQDAIVTQPWLFYIPGAFLVLLCVAINLVGDGLRDALDPT